VYSRGSPNAKPRHKASTALLIMEVMESGHPFDPLIAAADRALHALFAPARASRPVPRGPAQQTHGASASPPGPTDAPAAWLASDGSGIPPAAEPKDSAPVLAEGDRRKSAALMRVNHSGEVAAQALYHGQALASRSAATRDLLLHAAREESDHLAWCETRLKELGSRPSLLNPLWYLGSFAIGALAAAAGDRTSLGFVVETERQVEGHLDEHLTRLPADDTRSRAILNVMRTDEIGHGAAAKAAGAAELPAPLRVLMRHTARIMTTAAYWI
jgi:ubiquinone biosynthesis monooxygenase Coq7